MKAFPGSGIFVPRPWLDAMGAPQHRQQAYVLVIAPNKTEATALLEDRTSGFLAHRIVDGLRLRRPPLSTPDELLVAAGVVDLDKPGVYAYWDSVKDRAVIRVEADGSCTVAGHFRYDRTTGVMSVEASVPVAGDNPAAGRTD